MDIGRELEPLEREEAKKRYDNTRPGVGEKFAPTEKEKGKALGKVAAALGMSRPTYVKAKEVVEGAPKRPLCLVARGYLASPVPASVSRAFFACLAMTPQ